MAERKTGNGSSSRKSGRGGRYLGYALKALAPLLVLALGAVSFAGLRATKPEMPQREARAQVWPVSARTASFSDFQPDIRLYGRTLAGRRVDMRALVGGEIAEIGDGLKDGGVVSKGDLLLRVDPFQYEGAVVEAEAGLAEARARHREIEATIASERDALERAGEQLQIARRDLERAQSLVEKGNVSQQVVDNRRLTVSEREQTIEQRAGNLAVQKAKAEQQQAVIDQLEWKLRQAKRDRADTELRAPFDAYVNETSAEAGRIVSANDSVATLLDRGWIEVRFTLTNTQYGRIASHEGDVIGRPVEVLWHLGETPVRYEARIERVAAEVEPQTGGVEVYARLAEPQSPVPLRPGAFVEVRMRDRVYADVARLPDTALYGSDTVYVLADGRLQPRKVALVGEAGGDILVRGDLQAGEPVMTTRLTQAEAGLRVREQ